MKAALTTAVVLLSAATACADVLFLNDGSEINGSIKSFGPQGVEIALSTTTRTYPQDKLLRVQLVREFRPAGQDRTLKSLLAAPPAPQNFPDDAYLFWLTDLTATLKADGSMKTANRTVKQVLRERGRDAAGNDSYSFMPGVEQPVIDYAYSVNKGTPSYLTDASVQEGTLDPGYPIYDKRKSLKFSLPNVDPGTALDIRVTTDKLAVSTYPPQGYFSFRGSEPRKTARLTLEAPGAGAVKFIALNMPENVHFSSRNRKGHVQMVWEAEDMPSYKNEPLSPPNALFAPAVYFAPADDWEAIRSRFAPLLAPAAELTPEIKTLLASLTKDKTSETDRLEAIYNWELENIKFQSIGMASGGYLPRTAEEIFKTRAGNTLDKPFLLYALLKEAGFRPQLVYMATRTSPFQEAVPTIRQFSYAAVLAQADGREYALTPYSPYLRFDQRPGWMDGACGLKLLGSEGKDLFRCLGQEPPDKNSTTVRYDIELSKSGDAEGSLTIIPSGSEQAGWRQLREMNPAETDKYFERIAHGISPRARLGKYSMRGIEGLTDDVQVGFSFTAKDFAIRSGKKFLLFKLPGTEYSAQVAALTQRELPMFWQRKSMDRTVINLKLPKGWRVYHTPQTLKADGAGNTFSGEYKVDDSLLTCTVEYTVTETDQPAEKWAEFRQFRQTIAAFGEEWIILEKK